MILEKSPIFKHENFHVIAEKDDEQTMLLELIVQNLF